MSKKDLNKAVGNSFEDLKDEEMAKTQGAGDTEAETITLSVVATAASVFFGLSKVYDDYIKGN